MIMYRKTFFYTALIGYIFMVPVRGMLSYLNLTPFSFLFDQNHTYHLIIAGIYLTFSLLVSWLFSLTLVTNSGIKSEIKSNTLFLIRLCIVLLIAISLNKFGKFWDVGENLVARGGLVEGFISIFLNTCLLISFSQNNGILRYSAPLLILILGLSSGSKALFVFPLIAIVIFEFTKPDSKLRELSALKIVILFSILTALVFVLLIFSTIGRHSSEFDLAGYLGRYNEVIISLANRFYGIESLALIISHDHDLAFSFGYFSSYLNLIYGFIPSFLWESKPTISFGIFLSQDLFGPVFLGKPVAASGTMLGEGIVNGSVYLGFLNYLFDLLLIWVFFKLLLKLNIESTAVLYLLLSFGNLIEGELVGNTIRIIAFFIATISAKLAMEGASLLTVPIPKKETARKHPIANTRKHEK